MDVHGERKAGIDQLDEKEEAPVQLTAAHPIPGSEALGDGPHTPTPEKRKNDSP